MKKIKLLLTFTFLLTIFTVSCLNFMEWDVFTQNNGARTNLSPQAAPMIINGNGDFSTYSSVGNGTAGNPYIIQDEVINAFGWGIPGIIIQNTNAFFILQNCTVADIDGISFNAGIYLLNVTNGVIINNNVSKHYGFVAGIALIESHGNNISHNNFNRNFMGMYINHSNWNTLINNSADYCESVALGTNAICLEYSNGNTLINNSANFCDSLAGGTRGIYLVNSNGNWLVNNSASYCNNTAGSTTGILLDNSHHNRLVENILIGNTNEARGIHVSASDNNTIINNSANNNEGYGIHIANSENNILIGNQANSNYPAITNEGTGVWVASNSINSTLSHNTANDNLDNGIQIQSNNNTLQFNTAQNNSIGIGLLNANYNELTNNTCSLNTLHGICVENFCDSNTLTNNTIKNNGNSGIFVTILLSGANEIIQNTVTENVYAGICVNNSGSGNIIEYNLIKHNEMFGIYHGSGPTLNNFTGNVVILNDAFGVFVDGTLNYFYQNIIILNNQCRQGYQVVDNGGNVWVANIVNCTADQDADGLNNQDEIAAGSDLWDEDTDGDNLKDGAEVASNTNPIDADTDDDNVTDYDELYFYDSNATNSDTDGDGLSDGMEAYTYYTNLTDSDTDGDGLSDPDELGNSTNPNNPDSDGDFLNDGAEFIYGTDPLVNDTDGDGHLDGVEVVSGNDPMDPGNYPGRTLLDQIDTLTLIMWILIGVIIALSIVLFLYIRKRRR